MKNINCLLCPHYLGFSTICAAHPVIPKNISRCPFYHKIRKEKKEKKK